MTEPGKPFTPAGFGNWFRDRCIEAGVPGRAHGLRKAAASRLAELGAPEKEIMAITGHTTSKEIMRYTRAASQRTLATNAVSRYETETAKNKDGLATLTPTSMLDAKDVAEPSTI
jgi:integrase